MGTRRRRRLDVALLAVAAVLVGVRPGAGRGGRGRAGMGAAGPDPGGVGPVAAGGVVPAVPGRLRGPHHAEEAAKRGYLREYTAWAVAVGELDRWSRAVAASSTAAAGPAVTRYPRLAPLLLSGTSGSSVQPSSSGSGGGGGVGGGAGGGGGGSW